ncbi:DUF2795 domain-containing protein [Streptodolium elevatio]|uniref:DUF2795 domain-containing protein n=1 Tax=Streptodolium elevatio TaxID=3157996 RepID=A0ABV3DSN4_9ACTN
MAATPPRPALDLVDLSELRRVLHGAAFPARPAQLAAHAQARRAGDAVVRALAALPDHPIVGPNQVCAALGHHHGPVQTGP